MKPIFLLIIAALLFSCRSKSRVDLAKLTFTEKAGDIINYDDKNMGGVNTVDSRWSFALEAHKSSSFSFNGLDIDSANVIFKLRSDKIRKDTSLYQGGGTYIADPIKSKADLTKALNKYQADSVIYGYSLSIKTPELKESILNELTKLYGAGIKNPNTEHGLYWNLKSQHRYVFYAPDYNDLVVVDNAHLSKTCYADFMTGLIDFGGCDVKAYAKELLK